MSEENATQPGAEELQPAYSARAAVMAQIAKQVHDDNAGDMADFDETTGQVSASQNQPKVEEDKDDEHEVKVVEKLEIKEPEEETIVVDGKEVRVERAKLIEAGKRTLQKESAADRRLQEATETLRRAQALERSALQRQPSSDAGEDSQMPSSDASNGSGEQSMPDIGTTVESVLWNRDASKAAKQFEREFEDIVKDPFAMRLVVQLENERLQNAAAEGAVLYREDPWEAYKTHGEKVREWLGKSKPSTPAISEDKSERKRSTTTVQGASAKVPTSQNQKPLTTSEQIERMRVARMGRSIPMNR